MSRVLLTAGNYRWLASLPADERRFVLELLRHLNAHFVDSTGPLNAWFASELLADGHNERTS